MIGQLMPIMLISGMMKNQNKGGGIGDLIKTILPLKLLGGLGGQQQPQQNLHQIGQQAYMAGMQAGQQKGHMAMLGQKIGMLEAKLNQLGQGYGHCHPFGRPPFGPFGPFGPMGPIGGIGFGGGFGNPFGGPQVIGFAGQFAGGVLASPIGAYGQPGFGQPTFGGGFQQVNIGLGGGQLLANCPPGSPLAAGYGGAVGNIGAGINNFGPSINIAQNNIGIGQMNGMLRV